MRSQLFVLCVVAVLTAACAPAAQVDIEAEQAALMERDKAWAEAVPDVDKIVSFLADDVTVLQDDGARLDGKEASREMWENIVGLPGFALAWEPTEAVVAKSGELGYTVGTSEFTVNGPDGNPVTTSGKYLTVWRKQSGEWMVTADIFNNDAPPAAE